MDYYNHRSLVKQFGKRLIEAYGYSHNQLVEDYQMDSDTKVDIAIWRDAKSKDANTRPDIFVVFVCRE